MSNHFVSIRGNLAADPEVRTIPSGARVAKFRVAVSDYKFEDGHMEKTKTHWVNVNAWKDHIIDTAARKGSLVVITGQLDYQEWTTNDGSKRSKLDIKADTLDVIENRQDASQGRADDRERSPLPVDDDDGIPF